MDLLGLDSLLNHIFSIPLTIPFLNNNIIIQFNYFNFIIISVFFFLFLIFCILLSFIWINQKLKDIKKLYENDLETKYKSNTDILNEINNNLKHLNKKDFKYTTLDEDIDFMSKKIK